MKAVSIYILEDDPSIQMALKESLEFIGYYVLGVQDNAQDALEEITNLKPDLAILDIHVKGEETGIWLADRLEIPFIYLSGSTDKKTLVLAGLTQPYSYLVKPFEATQVAASIDIALSSFTAKKTDADNNESQVLNNDTGIIVKDGHIHKKVQPENISCMHTSGKYTALHIDEKKILVRSSLTKLLEDFPNKGFIQVHKAYAINMRKVKSYSTTQIQLVNQNVPLSRTYKTQFFEEMSVMKQI